jgi:hypothetical protein
MDSVAQGGGHQGLADALDITDNSVWRGFVISSKGDAVNISHFNKVDQEVSGSALQMRPEHFEQVKDVLKRAGLIQ